jgi:hypothetical protein
MIACNATISAMLHDADGNILNVGRRTRKLSAALRRAVRERDRHRCRYPGCESRRVDAHHIRFWSNGGKTMLGNLISLCKAHHHLVHDKGVIIAATSGGFAFYLPSGARLANSPPLPPSSPNPTAPRSPRPPSSRRTPAAASTSTWPSGSPSPTPKSAPDDASRQRKRPRPRPPESGFSRRGWSSCAAGPSGGRRAPRPGRGPRRPSARRRRPRTRPGCRRR